MSKTRRYNKMDYEYEDGFGKRKLKAKPSVKSKSTEAYQERRKFKHKLQEEEDKIYADL